MAIYKEWMKPLAAAMVRNQARGPVYMLGDTECFFSPDYAVRGLRKAGFLKNPDAPVNLRNDLLSARSFFAMLGAQPYYDIDINPSADLRLDLSQPMPENLLGAAQTVLDVGTTEHVFDVAQVFKNIVQMLKIGGTVIHLSPVSWFNHGFYNFNPLLFREFYAANGFRRLEHGLLLSPLHYPVYNLMNLLGIRYNSRKSRWATPSILINDDRSRVDLFVNNIFMFPRAVHVFVARKESQQEVVFPVQGAYALTPAPVQQQRPSVAPAA